MIKICAHIERMWDSRGVAPVILDLDTRLRWIASFTLRPPYYQENNNWYPMNMRLGGPQGPSRKFGIERNSCFTFMCPCTITDFFIIKPTRCTNFTNLFWYETLHVSNSSSVHMSYRFIDSCQAGPGWNSSSVLVLLESSKVNKLLMMDRRNVRNM